LYTDIDWPEFDSLKRPLHYIQSVAYIGTKQRKRKRNLIR
jgi:hypothetical protein